MYLYVMCVKVNSNTTYILLSTYINKVSKEIEALKH